MMDFDDLLPSFFYSGLIVLIFFVVVLIYDKEYIEPIASESANNYCKNLGYDQYKTFSRIGFFSKVPVGIKCEFAEKYTDLGVRTN